MTIAVTDNTELSRYEIHIDGALAGIEDYRIDGGTITLIHTEIFEAFAGQGLAGKLVAAVLDHARARGLRAKPRCRYAKGWVARHPEYDDIVDKD
ncbi:GNAT family N-acetyltransferase [soil metagenome]